MPKYSLFAIACFFFIFSVAAQHAKPTSYIISKTANYTMDIKSDKPDVNLFSEEKRWIGDKNESWIKGTRIDYVSAFEEVTDIEGFSISPQKKKQKIRNIISGDVEIENIFYHDMKYKYYYYDNLTEGSETYAAYRKKFNKPEFLNSYYFRNYLDCKTSQINLKVSDKIEMGYILQGEDTDKVIFSSRKEGDYTIYSWEMKDVEKEAQFEQAPGKSYYSPHLIFYIKNYKSDSGTQDMLGSVDNLYAFYYGMTRGINKTDETLLKKHTDEITAGLPNNYEKTKAIFNYVQTYVNYVAFEDGMGGFIPRDAAHVFQKKYGDCKDMANLLNEMLNHAEITSHVAWIGTRDNNYTYENVPTPIADNHMIVVATIDNTDYFLDATGQYSLFPNITPFIQGKEALLRIDEHKHQVLKIPEVPAERNNTSGKITFRLEGPTLVGKADFEMTGFVKTSFISHYRKVMGKTEMLRNYLSRYIENISASDIDISNDDLTQTPLVVSNNFTLEKWVKQLDGKLIFKPILFFPYSDSRIDTDKRTVPYDFDYKQSFRFEYELTIPEGYRMEYKPADLNTKSALIRSEIKYVENGNKLLVTQTMTMDKLLLTKKDFAEWNTAIKEITKQYNQNIILSKK